MTDSEQQIFEYLTSGLQPTLALSALVGYRIYNDLDLPVGYQLTDGDCIVFKTRSGPGIFHSHSLNPSVQFMSHSFATPIETTNTLAIRRAKAIDAALYEALEAQRNGYFKYCHLETEGQLLRRRGGMYFYLSFYRFWLMN